MLFLSEKNEYIKQLLDEQKIASKMCYRPFKYVTKVEEKNGIILLNNLTDQVVYLNEIEKTVFFQPYDFSNETLHFLVENWFLVPEDFDDLEFSKNTENTLSLIYRTYRKKPINSFTILTTTDCNARCFYCYQHGCEYKTMSKKTATDVADYILNRKSDNEISLRWFGGEPLYNSDAIDIIVNKLIDNNVKFQSLMTTNGYLFDPDIVLKAKTKWNLRKVQITLDGTEEIYNKVKAYIYKDNGSAFKKVTDNIESLLKNDIIVIVRMNMDEHNIEDLFKLTDELLNRYKNYDNFFAYVHLLYENSCKQVINRDIDRKKYIQKECDRLSEIIKKSGKLKLGSRETKFFTPVYRCMADTDSSIMILPDGKLGKCEHYLDDSFVGSIYDDKVNLDIIDCFKEITTICEDCDNCELRSRCRSLRKCPSTRSHCSEDDKERRINLVHNLMKQLYRTQKSI